MLPAGLSFVGDGVRVVASAPEAFQGGVGVTNAGLIATSASAPTEFPNGNPCIPAGNLTPVEFASAVPPITAQNGVNCDSNGRIVTIDVGSAVAPISASNGFNFDANGALVTSV
jgi:hypothetical protein